MLTTIHQLTTHYLMRSVLPRTLGKDEAAYVEYGFARFVDAETKTVAVDEPLVLLAATYWINTNHQKAYKFFANQIEVQDRSSNGFENYIAYCIDMLFSSKRRLNEVFLFSGSAPDWCNLEAELVSLQRTALDHIEESPVCHFTSSGSSVNLGIRTTSPEETSKWLEHRSHSPICFPHLSMGPDLMFILRLSDGSLIWVALQAKYSKGINGSLSRKFLRHAVRSVTPCNFFLNKVSMFAFAVILPNFDALVVIERTVKSFHLLAIQIWWMRLAGDFWYFRIDVPMLENTVFCASLLLFLQILSSNGV